MKQAPFKICMNCRTRWKTLEDFLSDPEIVMVGYQVHYDDLKGGLFLFNHHREGCYTSLAIPVLEFTSLSRREFLAPIGTPPPGEECSKLCMRQGALDPCQSQCECAWVREVIQTITDWKKTES